jgi:hypothetical protein
MFPFGHAAFAVVLVPKRPQSPGSCTLNVGKTGKGQQLARPVSPAQMLYAKKIAQGKGVVIPEEAKADSVAMSAWIDSNRSAKRGKRSRNSGHKLAGSIGGQSTMATPRGLGSAKLTPLSLQIR